MKRSLQIIFFISYFMNISYAFTQAISQIETDTTQKVFNHIYHTWNALTRTHASYFKTGATNSNVLKQNNILYISKNENIDKVRRELKQQLTIDEYKKVRIKILPENFSNISEHGLLYLPYSYVVPGGILSSILNLQSLR